MKKARGENPWEIKEIRAVHEREKDDITIIKKRNYKKLYTFSTELSTTM